MLKQKNIAIIGFGFSGAMVFYNLVNLAKESSFKPRITIFEKSENLAKGTAYSTQNPNHLLNVRALKMSAVVNNSSHFTDWLKQNDYSYEEEDFVPRVIYGKYLESLFEKAKKIAAENSIDFEIEREEIMGITKTANGQFSILGNVFDDVVLATGAEIAKINNKENVWNDDLEKYLNQNEIHILGAGLTMVDTLISLDDLGFKGKIFVHSRTGLLPQIYKNISHNLEKSPLNLEDAKLPLSEIVKKFKIACKIHENWLKVFDNFRPLTQSFWKAMPIQSKKRFLKYLYRIWGVHRHIMPPKQFARLQKLQNEERLFFTKEKILPKNYINCVGFNPKAKNVLLEDLLSQKIILNDELEAGFISNSKHFHLIGFLRFGELFETVAVPELRVQTHEVAQRILG